MTTAEPPTGPDRLDNGLFAPSYVPLVDVSGPIAPRVLTALGRARIAAYLAGVPTDGGPLRLYVSSAERADARTIVASVVRASDDTAGPQARALSESLSGPLADPATDHDPLAGIDSDAEFARLVADWHVDTVAAIREAERELTREDEDWRQRLNRPAFAENVWLDDDHFVPPAPPPMPRFAAPTIMAMSVIAISIILLGFGGQFGLASRLTLLLGVLGVLLGVGILISRMREHREEDDDGAVL